jgi:uncharacterized protein (TIGR00251 family)
MCDSIYIDGDAIRIDIKALPGASKTEFAGIKDGRLRIRLAAAPEKGRANAELIGFIAGAAGCPKKDIVLLRGEKSRVKTIALPAAYRVQLEKIISGQ